MTNDEVKKLVKKYFEAEDYGFPEYFEHRVDRDSLKVIYSFIREFKPTNALQIGTWEGGTTLAILSALIKNDKRYQFTASELLDDKRRLTQYHSLRELNTSPVMIGDITKNIELVPNQLDFLFHDTDHDLETTTWVLENIFPRLKKGSLVIFHDWAVTEKDGKWMPKKDCWPETSLMCDLHNGGNLPLEKVYWNFNNPGNEETGVFIYNK